MTKQLFTMFKTWEALERDPNLENRSLSQVLYLAEKRYNDYEPDSLIPFTLRLDKWLDNCSDENDKKLLISLLANSFFAGRQEFESLYRSAVEGVKSWIVDKENIALTAPNIDDIVNKQLINTWICPITDSLRINQFLKINNINGHDRRPDWRSLADFGDVSLIKQYINKKSISRLVLLEDFVGSGSQIIDTVNFTCKKFVNMEVLLCPLIVCPEGDINLTKLSDDLQNLTYKPSLKLPAKFFLKNSKTDHEPMIYENIRELINRMSTRLSCGGLHKYGYKDTGGLVIMHSNCPDNTLPIFRDDNDNWNPLFPRVWRPE